MRSSNKPQSGRKKFMPTAIHGGWVRLSSNLVYLVLAVLVAVITITVMTLMQRLNRTPTKSVDSFQRAIQALKPDRRPRDKPK